MSKPRNIIGVILLLLFLVMAASAIVKPDHYIEYIILPASLFMVGGLVYLFMVAIYDYE